MGRVKPDLLSHSTSSVYIWDRLESFPIGRKHSYFCATRWEIHFIICAKIDYFKCDFCICYVLKWWLEEPFPLTLEIWIKSIHSFALHPWGVKGVTVQKYIIPLKIWCEPIWVKNKIQTWRQTYPLYLQSKISQRYYFGSLSPYFFSKIGRNE